MRLEALAKRASGPGPERGPPRGLGVTQELKAREAVASSAFKKHVQTVRWTLSWGQAGNLRPGRGWSHGPAQR